MARAPLRVHPFNEEQTMQKARKLNSPAVARSDKHNAGTTPKTAPKPLDEAAQRLVGGGKMTPSTPRQGW
jgi:hypothetical protein